MHIILYINNRIISAIQIQIYHDASIFMLIKSSVINLLYDKKLYLFMNIYIQIACVSRDASPIIEM